MAASWHSATHQPESVAAQLFVDAVAVPVNDVLGLRSFFLANLAVAVPGDVFVRLAVGEVSQLGQSGLWQYSRSSSDAALNTPSGSWFRWLMQ